MRDPHHQWVFKLWGLATNAFFFNLRRLGNNVFFNVARLATNVFFLLGEASHQCFFFNLGGLVGGLYLFSNPSLFDELYLH